MAACAGTASRAGLLVWWLGMLWDQVLPAGSQCRSRAGSMGRYRLSCTVNWACWLLRG